MFLRYTIHYPFYQPEVNPIKPIRYFDLFAGVGGFRAGLGRVGGYTCVGHCEIDKYAERSYRAMHDIDESEVYYPDARAIDTAAMPGFELLCAGFPCQSHSIAGLRKSLDDPRGALFYEIARILQAKQPAYFMLENVPGLLSSKTQNGGYAFAQILSVLCGLGYCCEWFLRNAKNHGVPQSRRRLFIIGYLDPRRAGKILPLGEANPASLVQLAGGRQGSRVYGADGLACTLTSGAGGLGGKSGLYAVGYNRKDGVTKGLDTAYALTASDYRGLDRNQTQTAVFVDMTIGNPKITDTARCVTANYGKSGMSHHNGELSGVLLIKEATKKGYAEARPGDGVNIGYAGSNTRRGRVGKGVSQTLTCQPQGVVERYGRIRRLTPRECFRLQGFDEGQIDRALAVVSDAQAYRQAGNSVTVNVVHAIGVKLRAVHEEFEGNG